MASNNSPSFTDFLYAYSSESNGFPTQNLLLKPESHPCFFDWSVPLEDLQFICEGGLDDQGREAVLRSPHFFLGQEARKVCKWLLKIGKSPQPAPQPGGLHAPPGFSLKLLLDERETYMPNYGRGPMIVKAKFSIVDKNSQALHINDDYWNCFSKLDYDAKIGAPVFFTLDEIQREKRKFAEDGILRIKLEIVAYGENLKSELPNMNKTIPQLVINEFKFDPMLLTLRNLWETKEGDGHGDVIFQCGKYKAREEFVVHRILISHASSLFDEMITKEIEKLSEERMENEDNYLVEKIPRLIFEDIEPKVMEVLLKHIYFKYWVSSAEGENEAAREDDENIGFTMADKCLRVTQDYQLEKTEEALFNFFIEKCGGRLEFPDKTENDFGCGMEMFCKLLYLGCKYQIGAKIKMGLQELYLAYFSFCPELRKEKMFQNAKDEFTAQFLDILFGEHNSP